MKKLITAIMFAIGIAIIAAPSTPARAQVLYCGHCCDTDVYGNARIRCTLVTAGPCGGACECNGVPGYGFCCY